MIRNIFTLIITALSASILAAPSITIQPTQSSYAVGDKATISINLTDFPKIYGGGLNITFNPSVLRANSVQVNPSWNLAIKQGIINNKAGKIEDILFTHFPGLEGNIPVATIVMDIIASGSPGIGISESPKNPFSDTSGNSVAFSTNNLAANLFVGNPLDTEPETTEPVQQETTQSETEKAQDTQTTTEQTQEIQTEPKQASTEQATTSRFYQPSGKESTSPTSEGVTQNNEAFTNTTLNNTVVDNSSQQNYAADNIDIRQLEEDLNTLAKSRSENDATTLNTRDNSGSTKSSPITSGSTVNNRTAENNDIGKSDDYTQLLIMFVFLILAFVGYKIFASRKK